MFPITNPTHPHQWWQCCSASIYHAFLNDNQTKFPPWWWQETACTTRQTWGHCVMSCVHGILGLPHSVHNTTWCTLVGPPCKCSWHPLWVSLTVCATPPNVPSLAHLLCAHTTYMVPLQVCAAHATPSSTCMRGCTTFPSAPVIFPHLHMTLQHSTLGSDLQCTWVHILPSLLPLVCLAHAHNIAQWHYGSSSQCAHARVHNAAQPAPGTHTTSHSAPVGLAQCAHLPHMCVGITPVLELVVLHYIYCTLNKRLSALPLTILCACVTIGPDLIYALNN